MVGKKGHASAHRPSTTLRAASHTLAAFGTGRGAVLGARRGAPSWFHFLGAKVQWNLAQSLSVETQARLARPRARTRAAPCRSITCGPARRLQYAKHTHYYTKHTCDNTHIITTIDM